MNTAVCFEEISSATPIEYLEKLNHLAYGADKISENNWIFRGQNNAEYPLIPTVFRNCKRGYKSIFDKIHERLLPGVPDLSAAVKNHIDCLAVKHNGKFEQQHKTRLMEIIKSTFVELKLVEKFLLECNRAGLYAPSLRLFISQLEERSAEEYLYFNLEKICEKFVFLDNELTTLLWNLPSYFPYKNLIDFDFPNAIALARHHRIPNRFLDWTENPLYAAFFSAYEAESDGIAVWAINMAYTSDFNNPAIRFHKKLKHEGLEFLHKQKGLFTEMMGDLATF